MCEFCIIVLLSGSSKRTQVTQLSIPTHAQLRHRLKFIKNHLKKKIRVLPSGKISQSMNMS